MGMLRAAGILRRVPGLTEAVGARISQKAAVFVVAMLLDLTAWAFGGHARYTMAHTASARPRTKNARPTPSSHDSP
jgi:hypothetical protein